MCPKYIKNKTSKHTFNIHKQEKKEKKKKYDQQNLYDNQNYIKIL